jgi:hypothetical protein
MFLLSSSLRPGCCTMPGAGAFFGSGAGKATKLVAAFPLEHFRYYCGRSNLTPGGFSVKKSHKRNHWAVYTVSENAPRKTTLRDCPLY